MLAQVVLTTSEVKKLIAKAVLQLPEVRKAIRNGLIVIHPSSSTYFIVQEILGSVPEGLWVGGMVRPKGLCTSREGVELSRASGHYFSTQAKNVKNATYSWAFENGQDVNKNKDKPLYSFIERMGTNDVYIKGGNAIDVEGNVGILWANEDGSGGTIGYVMRENAKRAFHVILPIGLEKLIPGSIKEAARAIPKQKIDIPMGKPCGLFPILGRTIVTEQIAVSILSGASATPIAAGGLGGAEGASVLAIKGDKEAMERIMHIVSAVKGARLPQVKELLCSECTSKSCSYYGRQDI